MCVCVWSTSCLLSVWCVVCTLCRRLGSMTTRVVRTRFQRILCSYRSGRVNAGPWYLYRRQPSQSGRAVDGLLLRHRWPGSARYGCHGVSFHAFFSVLSCGMRTAYRMYKPLSPNFPLKNCVINARGVQLRLERFLRWGARYRTHTLITIIVIITVDTIFIKIIMLVIR